MKTYKPYFHYVASLITKAGMTMSFILITFMPIHAQKTVKVEGTYTYYAPDNVTVDEAKYTALNRAKIQALAEKFGTVVSQINSTRMANKDGKTESDFLSIGTSDVKGDWIETIGTPEYKVDYVQNMLVVTVNVKGIARELATSEIDIEAHVLRNGTEEKFEGDKFKHGDELYLSFQSPVNGYLAVYLVDATPKAYCLLPYRGQQDGIYKIEANKRYTFFSKKKAMDAERHIVDEYIMTCSAPSEHNQIYVIFSPMPFAKANDNKISDTLPRELDYDDFLRWMSKCKRTDTQVNTKAFPITLVR